MGRQINLQPVSHLTPGGYAVSRAPYIDGDICVVPLACGKRAICDAADYAVVSRQRNWCIMKGYPSYTDNLRTPRRTVKLHQLLMPGHDLVDHRNGDKLDNRRNNLRAASIQQNSFNRASAKGSSSRFKGVTWDRSRGKWMAAIQINGRTKTLGRFLDEEMAALAYNEAAKVAHGEFARLNEVR